MIILCLTFSPMYTYTLSFDNVQFTFYATFNTFFTFLHRNLISSDFLSYILNKFSTLETLLLCLISLQTYKKTFNAPFSSINPIHLIHQKCLLKFIFIQSQCTTKTLYFLRIKSQKKTIKQIKQNRSKCCVCNCQTMIH